MQTSDIQGLRSDCELSLSDAVTQANNAIKQIADITRQLGLSNVQTPHGDPADQRMRQSISSRS